MKEKWLCKGLGVGYLPSHRIAQELAGGRLVLLTLAAPRPPEEISVAGSISQSPVVTNLRFGRILFQAQLKALDTINAENLGQRLAGQTDNPVHQPVFLAESRASE